MKLTFKNNNFVLAQNNKESQTLNLKAALRFRQYADLNAEKVFTRTLSRMYDAPSTEPPPFLDSHQKVGVNWILTRKRSYLAHAPGAGKTAQAIVASIMAQGQGQTVFIVPPSLTTNWEREILKWTEWANIWPSISIVPRSDKQHSVDWKADFIVVPDSMLTKSWVYDHLQLLCPKLIAVDEASRFKECTSERTKALFGGVGKRTYFGLIQNARHAVLLDGSPMPNRPMELWAPVTAMDPEAIGFKDMHDFGVYYCAGRFIADGYKLDWDYRGASNQTKLRFNLQRRFMHVVNESQLNHPERKRSLLYINDDARIKMIKTFEHKHLSKINLNDIDEDMNQGDIARYRKRVGLTKTPWVVNYVKERYDKNESILIFAWHREVCRELAYRLESFGPGLVMGGTPGEEREDIFARFQSGATRIIIGNIQAMGRGHNLQRAKRIIFAEYSWTDELNKQCEKRASRKGATNESVRCDYVVAPGTLDEVILNAVFTKERNVKRVIG